MVGALLCMLHIRISGKLYKSALQLTKKKKKGHLKVGPDIYKRLPWAGKDIIQREVVKTYLVYPYTDVCKHCIDSIHLTSSSD